MVRESFYGSEIVMAFDPGELKYYPVHQRIPTEAVECNGDFLVDRHEGSVADINQYP